MAITSANPDNDSTTKTALSFGPAAAGTDSNADGEQSLRAEFTAETNTTPSSQPRVGASLSEYYKGQGVVPLVIASGNTTTGQWTNNELVEYNPDKQPPNAYVDTIEEPMLPSTGLYYVRRVNAAGAALFNGVGSMPDFNEGDLIFAWGSKDDALQDLFSHEFIVSNGIIGQAYTHEGYEYATGGDASGESVMIYLNVMGVSQFDLRSVWNNWFDTYFVRRRLVSTAVNEDANEIVPLRGSPLNERPLNPISFSQLYGANNYSSGTQTIVGHNAQTYGTIGATSNYISNSYPTTITTDGTNVRSGNHSATTGSNTNVWRSALVPMGTFYVDPNAFTGNIKIKYPVITYRSSGDVDPGGRVDVRNVGVKVNHLGSNNAQTGIMFASDIFTLTGADGQSLNSSHNPRTINTNGTFSATTNKTGRFIVYLTFLHLQTSVFADPDLNIKVEDFVIEWETA